MHKTRFDTSMLSISIHMFKHYLHIHVVLSALYQEKMFKERDLQDWKPAACPWRHIICAQCIKTSNAQRRTAELLYEVGCNEEGNLMKGQWAQKVNLLLFMIHVVYRRTYSYLCVCVRVCVRTCVHVCVCVWLCVSMTAFSLCSPCWFVPQKGYYTTWSQQEEGRCTKHSSWPYLGSVLKVFTRCRHYSRCTA